jgi:hypothetical protein
MTPEQIRLEALRLAIPNTTILTRDDNLILERAKMYEAYIVGDTQQPARVKRSTGKDSAELPTGAKP